MKIVDRQTFLAMPAETVYAKYEPCIFGEMLIKGDTIYGSGGEPIDWFEQQFVDAIDANDTGELVDLLTKSEKGGTSIPMDFDCQGRDGCFDQDQLFAVFERADVEQLIARLTRCISSTTAK